MRLPRLAVASLLAVAPLAACGDRGGEAAAGDCSESSEVRLGGSLPLSGPAAVYGVMGKSAAAVFDQVNAEGGVKMEDGKTRKIEYTFLDDGYEPARTVKNMKALVERDSILAGFQVFGTSNTMAARDYMHAKGVPLLLVNSGADEIQELNEPDLFGFLIQYGFQAKVVGDYILEHKPDAKIGILYQNNGLGQNFLASYEDVFDGTTAKIVSKQPYDLSAANVDSQLIALKNSGADVFLNYATGAFVPEAIKKAHEIGWKPLQVVGTETNQIATALRPAGPEAATGVVSMLHVKDVGDPRWASDLQSSYSDVAKFAPDLDWKSDGLVYYGALQAEIMVEAIRGMDGCTSTDLEESMRSVQLESDVLLPGISIATSENYAFAQGRSQMAKFDGKTWVAEGEVQDASVVIDD